MKSKCFALLSLILLLLFITACEKQPTDKQEQYIISTPKEMHLNGSNIAYENAMFFADDTGKACFLDYETMQSSVACNRPNCTHGSDCPSKQFAMFAPPPVVYKDNVYYFTSTNEFVDSEDGTQKEAEIETKLMKCSLKTGEIETFATIEGSDAVGYSDTYFKDNTLYFITSIGVQYAGDGTLTYGIKSGEQFLYSINLDTAETKNYGRVNTHENAFDGEIVEGNFVATIFSGVNMVGAYNGKLYMFYQYPSDPDELKEALLSGTYDMLDPNRKWEYVVVSFDFETGELSNVELTRPFCVGEDYYLYYDEGKYVVLDKDLNKIEIDCFSQAYQTEILGVTSMRIFDGKVWRLDEDDMCFDLETKQAHKLSRTDIEQVLAEKDGKYLIFYYQGDNRNFEWIEQSELLG